MQLTSLFAEFLNQTIPRLLDAPSLENVHAKLVSCGARHSAVITGTVIKHFADKLYSITISCFCQFDDLISGAAR